MKAVRKNQINKMYKIELPKTVHQLLGIFYRLGMWTYSDTTTVREFCQKLFYFIYFSSFILSIVVGALTTDVKDERVFLIVAFVIFIVQTNRMWIILWRKNGFLLLVNQIGNHSTNDAEELLQIKNKLNLWMKFIRYFLFVIVITVFFAAVVFPITNDKHLILNIAFPFDRNNDELAFWMSIAFVFGEFICAFLCDILTKMIWYLMVNISFEYQILGNQLRHMSTSMGPSRPHLKVSLAAQQQIFYKDFIVVIHKYDEINKYSNVFIL